MIVISAIQTSERRAWQRLWSEYQAFYHVQLPAAATEATWQRLHDGKIHGLGAHDSADRLIGIVHFLYHEDTWSTQPACYLQDLYVDAALRATGCGGQLIAAVAAAARSAGASAPYWLTHTTNDVARRLYDKVAKNHGFIHYQYAAAE